MSITARLICAVIGCICEGIGTTFVHYLPDSRAIVFLPIGITIHLYLLLTFERGDENRILANDLISGMCIAGAVIGMGVLLFR